MSIKKKVTYSVSYIAGTDTLSTKLNSILGDIVGLILSHNSGLSILDTITYGSERMTGAPLYSGGGSGLYAADYSGRYYQSDLIFLGTNENNICLSLGFFDGQLVIAMNMSPKAEKSITDVWSSRYGQSTTPLFAIGKQSRFINNNTTGLSANCFNYAIPYVIYNNVITISIIYWNCEYSTGYSICNAGNENDGVDLVIFPTDEGNNQTGIGAAIWPWGLKASYRYYPRFMINIWSFSENLIDNPPDSMDPDNASSLSDQAALTINATRDTRIWGLPNNDNLYGQLSRVFQMTHSFGAAEGVRASIGGYLGSVPDAAPWFYTLRRSYTGGGNETVPTGDGIEAYPLWSAYNLPRLKPGQAYIRKMRIPGWNPECKGEIYLLWAPVLTAYQSGDIVEVGDKSYAIITEGAVCWAARVL